MVGGTGTGSGGSGSVAAGSSNVQGALHLSGYLGNGSEDPRKKKKRKFLTEQRDRLSKLLDVIHKAQWDEGKHPRGKGGRWVHSGDFWHGTHTGVLASIEEHGLIPGASPGADSFAVRHKDDLPENLLATNLAVAGTRRSSVYLTPSIKTAVFFATLVAHHNKAYPIVLEVQIPKEELRHLASDSLLSGKGPGFAVVTSEGSFRPKGYQFEGSIKREWIKGIYDVPEHLWPESSDIADQFVPSPVVKADANSYTVYLIVLTHDDEINKAKRNEKPRTLYVSRPVTNGKDIIAWAKSQGFRTTLPDDDLHVTVAFSRAPMEWPSFDHAPLSIPSSSDRALAEFSGGAVVLRLVSSELARRWSEFCNLGASWDWPAYHPHITLTYKKGDVNLNKIQPYEGPIELGGEVANEVQEDWQDGVVEKAFTIEKNGSPIDKVRDAMEIMNKAGARHNKSDVGKIQEVHDHAVSLGATCNNHSGDGDSDLDKSLVRIAKIDENLGMVFGYAVVCKVNGEPYYDLNIDLSGNHAGERVPEHVPEDTMLKAAMEFGLTERVGNEMHKGPDKGVFVCMFPLTTDIAKAMGITTNVTGLMVGYKPPPDVLAKFKDGTYKGFSIEGRRLSYVEHE